MLRPFIVDSERNLIEKGDLLGTMCYADQLVDTIKGVPIKQACTIGLYGSWGSGKSTIIRTAQQKLEEDREKSIKMVVYDAWKYSGDSFRRMFLLQLQNELGLKPSEEMKRFYTATTEEIKPNLELRKRGIVYIAIALVLILLAVALVITLKDHTEAKIRITLIFSALSVLAASLGGNLFYELKVSQTKNILFAPEQFEECFRQMMKEVLKEKGWYVKKIFSHIQAFFCNEPPTVRGLDKLVIVIDNLDRCDTEVVYSMLTDIKTFLGTEKYDVVFVVPVDDEALKQHLFAKQEGDKKSMLKAEEFLRKFFNVVIRIKPHLSDDLYHYIHELNRDQKLEFDPNTLALVAKEYAENPRRILQMLNNVTVEQSLYEEDFARKNETLIAACMILREHYPQMIEKILNNPNILFDELCYRYQVIPSKINNKQKDKDEDGNEINNPKAALSDKLNSNDVFKAFMRRAKITLQNAEVSDLRRILTNTDNALTTLSDDVSRALDSYDVESIVTYIQSNPTLRTDIMLEIKRRIKEEDNNDAIDAMTQWAECIASVNIVEPLHGDELHDMDDALALIYDHIPRTLPRSGEICKLAKDMYDNGVDEFRKSLFDFVSYSENTKHKTYNNYVHSVLETFTEKEDCRELREFAEKYMFEEQTPQEFNLTDTQKQYLLTNTYVETIIDAADSVKNEKQQKLLEWCFANLIGLKTDVYDRLFSVLTKLTEPRNGKILADFMAIVQYALPILRIVVPNRRIVTIKNFYDSIVETRVNGVGHNKSITAEANEDDARILAELFFELYRISDRTLTINPSLQTVQKKCEGYVKEQLLAMQQAGTSLMPFRININAFVTIDEAWYELVPVSFEKDANGARSDGAILKQKIQLLYDHREDEKALDLLVRVTEDEDLCELFVSLLNIEDFDTLNALPEKLLPRIVGLYNAESAERFKTNNAMLKIVLKQNAKNVEDIVTRSLMNRLINGLDVEGAIDVIASHSKWHHVKNKRQLKATLEGMLPEENEEDVELTDIQKKIMDALNKLG